MISAPKSLKIQICQSRKERPLLFHLFPTLFSSPWAVPPFSCSIPLKGWGEGTACCLYLVNVPSSWLHNDSAFYELEDTPISCLTTFREQQIHMYNLNPVSSLHRYPMSRYSETSPQNAEKRWVTVLGSSSLLCRCKETWEGKPRPHHWECTQGKGRTETAVCQAWHGARETRSLSHLIHTTLWGRCYYPHLQMRKEVREIKSCRLGHPGGK